LVLLDWLDACHIQTLAISHDQSGTGLDAHTKTCKIKDPVNIHQALGKKRLPLPYLISKLDYLPCLLNLVSLCQEIYATSIVDVLK
jgi:hypothetical protein